jgi:hypothetical protein
MKPRAGVQRLAEALLKGPALVTLLVVTSCASAQPPAVAIEPPPAVTVASVQAPGNTTGPAAAPTVAAPAAPMSPGIVNVGDVIGPPHFDANTTLTELKPALLRCYNETRTLIPDLHGKLTLRLRLNETGAVTSTEANAGGRANDPGLLACIGDAMKATTFPKPGGTATITVPLVFRR